MEIRLLAPPEIPRILPLLKLLNPTLSEGLILGRLREMMTQSYECAAAFEGDELVACCGIWIFTKIYCGRFVEADNVCVHPDHRSGGLGARLIDWVHAYGESRGCIAAELNAYVHNSAAHKFWFNRGYRILGFHFEKALVPRRP